MFMLSIVLQRCDIGKTTG